MNFDRFCNTLLFRPFSYVSCFRFLKRTETGNAMKRLLNVSTFRHGKF